MSYILDALRRADAERERGQVPGLHAQPAPFAPDSEAPLRRPLPAWSWFAAGLGVMLIAALVWRLLAPDAERASTTVAAAAPVLPASKASMAGPVAAPVAAPAVATTAPEQTRTPTPPRAEHHATPVHAPHKAAATPATKPATSTSTSASTSAATTKVPSADERVYAEKDLPENIRRELPKLDVGGSIYSSSPASRFLIINGRVFHEHDPITHELTLEQIKLKSAVLSFRGYRYSISY